MNTTKLVSVIIPVYNAEIYLDKCIESVLDQSYTNLEVILINDGSTDSSEDICLRFSNIDNRVIYIKQHNAGPSSARNNGINIAKGEFIQFIDADDYLTPNSVEVMVNAMEDSDFVIASYYNLFENAVEEKVTISPKVVGKYFKDDLLPRWGELVVEEMFHYTWNKLYKNKFIKDRIKFDENIKISEDMIFNIDYISVIEKINIINTPIYYHIFYNQDSITKRYYSGLFEMRAKTHKYIKDFLISNGVFNNYNYEIVNDLYAKRIISLLIHLVSKNTNMSIENKRGVISNIISDNSVHEILGGLTNGRLERLTAFLIRNKRTRSIYYLYRFREHLHSVYAYIKKRSKKIKKIKAVL